MRAARPWCLGLGLIVAGAVLHAPLGAQVRDTIPRRRDSTTLAVPLPTRADSLLRDSLAKRGVPAAPRDSIKPPIAHAELPTDISVVRTVRWNRDSLFATGALNVADLLERVAGLSTFHAGWIGAPATAAYLGDFRRVRVFWDGVELRELDPYSGGVLDLTQQNIWAAEDAVIEQGPEETRLYLRSWRTRSTTPITRTDIATGDQQTNLYRGYLARRYDNGMALQFGAQQFGTTPSAAFGTAGDQLGIIARLGWANTRWSVDGFASRTSRHRGQVFDDRDLDSIRAVESSRTDAYVRVAMGDPDTSRVWSQALVASGKYSYDGVRTFTGVPRTPAESLLVTASLDSSVFRSQYVLSAGTVQGPLRASLGARLIGGGGEAFTIPSARVSYSMNRARVSAFVEGKGADSSARGDVTAQLTPLSFVTLLGSAGRIIDDRVADSSLTTTYLRGEAGLRFRNLWFVGGIMRRDSARLAPPRLFDSTLTARVDGPATAMTAGIRGQLWRFIQADISALRWTDTAGIYRPRYQTRSELFIRTNLLHRFPRNNFGLMFSAVHEYRSGTHFPVGETGTIAVPGYRTISTLLEIRIFRATASWQFRNLLGERYTQVPFFVSPRQTNFYGVRWEFLN